MTNGTTGLLVRVNLTNQNISTESIQPYREWIGGRSQGSYLLSRHPGLWSSEPQQQPVVIAAGPLVGVGLPMGTRTAVSARNQLSGGISYSNVGGDFGVRLRMAGVDALLIEGASPQPVYLLVQDGSVQILPAEGLWGKTISGMAAWLAEQYPTQPLSFLGIGPAGEHRVAVSCLMVDAAHAAGWGGSGALFGAKNLKAVVAIGDRPAPVFDARGLARRAEQLKWRIAASDALAGLVRGGTHGMAGAGGFSGNGANAARNLQDEYVPPEDLAKLREPAFRAWEIGRAGCYGCSIRCLHRYEMDSSRFGRQSGEGMHANSVRGLGTNLGVTDPEALFAAHCLCNDLGLDVDGAAAAIAFAFECAERGFLAREQTGGVRLAWGDGDSVVELVRQIGRGEGLGALLGRGVYQAAQELGGDSHAAAVTVKRIGVNEQGVRSHRAWALGIATATRGSGHLGGAPQTEHRRIPAEVGMKLFKQPAAGLPGAYEGKGKLAAWTEGIKVLVDSLGLCYFVYGWYDLSIGSPAELAEWYYLATGIERTGAEFHRLGLRCHHLERYLNHRLAGFDRTDDRLPDRFFDTPVSAGPYAGEKLDRARFDRMLDEYYRSLGWDVKTGLPTDELLAREGLAYLLENTP